MQKLLTVNAVSQFLGQHPLVHKKPILVLDKDKAWVTVMNYRKINSRKASRMEVMKLQRMVSRHDHGLAAEFNGLALSGPLYLAVARVLESPEMPQNLPKRIIDFLLEVVEILE